MDDATYTYAAITGFASKANTAKGISILGTTLGVGLAGYTFYTRRKVRLAAALAEALPIDRVPAPLLGVLRFTQG